MNSQKPVSRIAEQKQPARLQPAIIRPGEFEVAGHRRNKTFQLPFEYNNL